MALGLDGGGMKIKIQITIESDEGIASVAHTRKLFVRMSGRGRKSRLG